MPEFFTREQAEALLPALTPLLHDLQSAWDELVDATTASTRLRQRMIGDGHAHLGEMQSLTRHVETARQTVATLVAQVRAFGCVLKDPHSGLIDFPAQRFGRMVYLCWHLGEPRIDWWHDREGGFTGRQPLD